MLPARSDASAGATSQSPIIYFDYGAPYAYLTTQRAPAVFNGPVQLEAIALGAVFKLRGWGSWADTDQREARMAEIEARARRYGLPELAWPAGWPNHSLAANRAGVWARQQDAIDAFTRALFRRQFALGADISDVQTLRVTAVEVGLDPDQLVAAIQVGDAVFYGDDRLEEAAAAQAASRCIS